MHEFLFLVSKNSLTTSFPSSSSFLLHNWIPSVTQVRVLRTCRVQERLYVDSIFAYVRMPRHADQIIVRLSRCRVCAWINVHVGFLVLSS